MHHFVAKLSAKVVQAKTLEVICKRTAFVVPTKRSAPDEPFAWPHKRKKRGF